ncbi:MAG: hypothetical protein HY671_02795 [Chloroflexi bacterium]|nr:hypothetical protein [Chloroflexota bacterium]
MTDQNERQFISLTHDEAEHRERVTGDVRRRLEAASDAVALTLSALTSLAEPLARNEPRGFVSLLFARCANNIRFAVLGLETGYYTGASAVLGSAYEALLHGVLLESDPGEIAAWFRNEFSSRAENDTYAGRQGQKKRARKALLDFENDHSIGKDAMYEFIEKADKRIHNTVHGLADEFGVDVEQLMPEELAKQIEAGGRIDTALFRYALLSSFGKNLLDRQPPASDPGGPTPSVPLYLRHDEATLADLSLFAFYIAHRLLDFTRSIFELNEKEFEQDYEEWHKSIRELGEAKE